MTNPTLERAARAVWDAVCATNDETSGGYAGTMHRSPYYVDGFVDPAAVARAVLMAVRDDMTAMRACYHAEDFSAGIDAILNEEPK